MLYRSAISLSEHRTDSSDIVCTEYEQQPSGNTSADRAFTLKLTFWRQIQTRSFFDAAVTLDQLITDIFLRLFSFRMHCTVKTAEKMRNLSSSLYRQYKQEEVFSVNKCIFLKKQVIYF